jgi:hypothetical protein
MTGQNERQDKNNMLPNLQSQGHENIFEDG